MYRTPTKRVFRGLAGSPLATLTQAEQKSDFTLRIPKTPDREDPIVLDPLTVWIDRYNQTHGAIDEDCTFQNYAFDPRLGGSHPDGTDHIFRQSDDGDRILQDFGVKPERSKKDKRSFGTGLLAGDREIRMRRPTRETSWLFDADTFHAYLFDVKERKGEDVAVMVAHVLHEYYYRNGEDLDIWYKFGLQYWDSANEMTAAELMAGKASDALEKKGAKEVKSFRQYHVKTGHRFTTPAKVSRARRVLIVCYDYDGNDYSGRFADGIITPCKQLGEFIGELSLLRREQGFEIAVVSTIDRVFPDYKQALNYVRSCGLKHATTDDLLEKLKCHEENDLPAEDRSQPA